MSKKNIKKVSKGQNFKLSATMGMLGLSLLAQHNLVLANTLEELLKTKIQGATRFEQNLEESPSSVTVITDQEISKYQHETLADALNTVKGVYTSYDRAYQYTGVRGFSKPSDYNTRLLVLSDGFRLNEPLYDSALVGNELPIDIDWVKKLEYVSGTSSSLYGSNALLGIVDVKTLSGSDLNGSKLKVGLGSYGKKKTTYLQGGALDTTGNDWIAGITVYDRTGQNLGLPTKLDGETYAKGFAKINFDNWQAIIGFSNRNKSVPTGAYGTSQTQPGTEYQDDSYYGHLTYKKNIYDNLESSSKLKIAQYRYIGNFMYGTDGISDSGESRWVDFDQLLTYTGIQNHTLIGGINYQSNFKLHQWTSDQELNDNAKSNRFSIYAQDQWKINDYFITHYGIRYDRVSFNNIENNFNHVSPRVSLTYLLTPKTKVKLIHSEGYRAPNTYELRYNHTPSNIIDNHYLKAEELDSNELIVEHTLNASTLVSMNLFENKFKNFINPVTTDGNEQFQNIGQVKSKGVEFELQWLPDLNRRIKSSVTIQESSQENGVAINSPKVLGKVIADSPIPGTNLLGSIQFISASHVRTANGELPSNHISHLVISENKKSTRGKFSLKVNNLLNKKYSQAASSAIAGSSVAQDGRTYMLVWEYQP